MEVLQRISGTVESALPLSEAGREKLKDRKIVTRILSYVIIFLVSVWVFGGSWFLISTYRTLAQPKQPNGIQRSLSNLRAGALTGFSGVSERYLHGIYGRPLDSSNGSKWDWESNLRFPLSRDVTDYRSSVCKNKKFDELYKSGVTASVVIIFCNEPFETLLRSVHSILDRSRQNLLDEIILVDDGSSADHIKPIEEGGSGILENYLKTIPKTKLIRTGFRSGIVHARLAGIEAVKSKVFVILDSHIECQPGWLEALIQPISLDPTAVVMPHIDGIDKSDWEPKSGGVGCTLGIIWKVMEHAFSPDDSSPPERQNAQEGDYVSSPTMAGGLFAANKEFFMKIGGYDTTMTGWGAENVEFSFRLWQCGGKLLCTECSRVFHMFGGGKYYTLKGTSATSNRLKTMGVWMDEFADLAWHVQGRPSLTHLKEEVAPRLELRKELKCKDFKWFLDNVWPESDIRRLPDDLPYMGPLRNVGADLCLTGQFKGPGSNGLGPCSSKTPAYMYFKNSQRLMPETNDETCLFHGVKWDWCRDRQSTNQWKIKEVEDENNNILNSYIEKWTSADKKRWDEWGDKVLVKISIANRICLTIDNQKTKIITEPCQDDNDSQIWVWTRYKINKFWEDLHRD